LTTPAERAELAEIALLCAREAGALVSAGYRSRPRADEKGAHDLVTEFDRASQSLVCSRLASLAPSIPVVAEEDLPGASNDRPTGLVWYVDPLDGTTNFVHGHPFWCVSIGLSEDASPVAGAIVAPSIGVSWVGWIDDPSRGAPGEVLRNGERCTVSATARLAEAMLGTGFPTVRDRAPDDNFASFVSVKRASRAVRRCGSAAIDLAFVADGTYDGYWERALHVWDVAAGTALVRAAGGLVTALDGGPPDLHAGHVVATNGRIHTDLVGTLQPAR